MHLLLICFMLHQSDGGLLAPDVNLKFHKDVTNNNRLLNDIHNVVTNFSTVKVKRYKEKDVSVNYEINDKVTNEAIDTKVYSNLKYKYQVMLQKYETHAIQRGIERFRDIPYYMSIELHIRKDTLPPIYNFVANFTKKARELFNELYKKNFLTDIDKEFALLDTVQVLNGIVYGEELALLNDMIFKDKVNITTDMMITILKHFYNEFSINKRADTNYLCIKFEICRPSLRFTDYIGDMARELLKLSDVKLTDILRKLSIHIKNQSKFFQIILGKSSAIEMGMKLEESVFRNVSGIRTIFVGLRSYLARRYKFNQNPVEEINTRNKALRILVDIIDQSFDRNGDEILAMQFNIILNTLADWSEGRKNEIEQVLRAFVGYVVGLMKINLGDGAIKEIKALVDILMRKEDKNNTIYRYLLNHGSKFVRGKDIPLKMSSLM